MTVTLLLEKEKGWTQPIIVVVLNFDGVQTTNKAKFMTERKTNNLL